MGRMARTAWRWLEDDWPVVVVWAIALQGIVVVAAMNGYHPFSASTWERWDSALYEYIGAHGYVINRCTPELGGASKWCGDAGWFPLFPWVFGALHKIGLPLRGTAAAVSWAFTGGTLLLLWRTFLDRRRTAAAIGCLLYAAFAPGQVYGYAIFPLSMLAFFTVAHLWLLWRGRYVLAGLAGAAAALSYPIGVMLIPISALWLILDRAVGWRERLRRVAIASGLTLAGFLLLLVDQRSETGHWDAYFLVQNKYGHGFHDPFKTLWDGIHPLFQGSLWTIDNAPAAQTLFITVVLIAVLVHAVLRRATWTRLDLLLVIWAVITWAFPLTQANVSLYRSQAALLPLALLVRLLPRPILFLTAGTALWLSVPMAQLFLQSKLM
jgi:hypothetical protein